MGRKDSRKRMSRIARTVVRNQRFLGTDIRRDPSRSLAEIQADQGKGELNQALAFTALRDAAHKPFWFKEIRRATPIEDEERKIDIVVTTTDVGELYIQIKSSGFRARKFLHWQANQVTEDSRRMIVVVVHRGETRPALGARILGQLEMLHAQLIS